VNKLIKTIFVV